MSKTIAVTCATLVVLNLACLGCNQSRSVSLAQDGLVFNYDPAAKTLTVALDPADQSRSILIPVANFAYFESGSERWNLNGQKEEAEVKVKYVAWHFFDTVVLRSGMVLRIAVVPQPGATMKVATSPRYASEVTRDCVRYGVTPWSGEGALR